MILSGQSPDGRLVEIVELQDHPWFVASQFHPEFKSRPERPHPLFDGFIAAALGNAPASRRHEAAPIAAEATAATADRGARPDRLSAQPGHRPARTVRVEEGSTCAERT